MITGEELSTQLAQDQVPLREASTQKYLDTITTTTIMGSTALTLPEERGFSKKVGKVRDIYNDGKEIVLVTTDRLSAFDRPIAFIPFKGAVLNMISAFWLRKTHAIMPNYLRSVPHANVSVGTAVTPIPIEFVVRAYLTGSTATSILTHYNRGEREYCGIELPDGLKPHQKLAEPIVTPTTKSDIHDELISADEIITKGILSPAEWQYCSDRAIALFKFASEEAAKRGLILVDTKMEMGRAADGSIVLIDELFTPDCSRYWIASSYEAAFAAGKLPQNIDKEFIRVWMREQCDPYTVDELPVVPQNKIAELSRRYIMLYELITGLDFPFQEIAAAKDLNTAVLQAITWDRLQHDECINYKNLNRRALLGGIKLNSDGMLKLYFRMHDANDAKHINLALQPLGNLFKLSKTERHCNVYTSDTISNPKVLERLLFAFDIIASDADKTFLPKPRVAVIMGSDSDLETMKKAAETLESLGVAVETTLVSAHRTTDRLVEYARNAHNRGIQVIIAGAGGAAHLPGMVASMTPLTVIGVPVVPPTAAALGGVDALLSMLQMPTEVPVATVAIGNATNAGLLAARILAGTDPKLRQRIIDRQAANTTTVVTKALALEDGGWREYGKQEDARGSTLLWNMRLAHHDAANDPSTPGDSAPRKMSFEL